MIAMAFVATAITYMERGALSVVAPFLTRERKGIEGCIAEIGGKTK
jgi:hypothetical protein